MKKYLLLLCLIVWIPVQAQQKLSPEQKRNVAMDVRRTVDRMSDADVSAIKRIVDKYNTVPATNSPAKPKPEKSAPKK